MKIKTKLLMCLSCTLMTGNLMAQSSRFSEEEENVLAEMYDDIRKHADFLAEDAFADIARLYKFKKDKASILERYCHYRELRKYTHNYINTNPMVRIAEKDRIDSIYQDSIDAILIPYNPQITGHAISMAIRMSDVMNIPEKKQSKLMDMALDFARRLRKDPFTNFAREEMDFLQKTLRKKQLETVLDEKNNLQALLQTEKIWAALDRNHQTEQLDSTEQMTVAHRYYLLEMRYKDIYVGQYSLLDRNLQEIYRRKPKMIKMYEAIEEKQRMAERHKEFEKQQKEKKVGGEFSW